MLYLGCMNSALETSIPSPGNQKCFVLFLHEIYIKKVNGKIFDQLSTTI